MTVDDMMEKKIGGAERVRTDDLNVANVALSQLSYGPTSGFFAGNATPRWGVVEPIGIEPTTS